MQAETISVQRLFQERRQYRVPFFQRAYVWNREDQWERLWSDIMEKASARLDGEAAAAHFLGAAVLEPQKRQGLIGVDTYHVIDGQQRFTTLQYFLCSLASVLQTLSKTTYLPIIENCLRNNNPESMRNPAVEVYKVWPTFRDRENFHAVMTARSNQELRDRFPHNFTQAGGLKKIGVNHPAALEAVCFFSDQIKKWLQASDEAMGGENAALALAEAVLEDFRVVIISLGELDDAQIIFETLNGQGAKLNATDLIRNFIFMRADREVGDTSSELFQNYWLSFESDFWAESQRRGRLLKPRLEWFLQTSLQSLSGDEVEIGRLYANFRKFADNQSPVVGITEQLKILNLQSEKYRQLVTGVGATPVALYGKRIGAWDASTTHAIALRIAQSSVVETDQSLMYAILSSYFVRRAICGLPSKNYNKMFLQILKRHAGSDFTPTSLAQTLLIFESDTSRWPSDEEFKKSWTTGNAYPGRLDSSQAKSLLAELEAALRSSRSEEALPIGLDSLDVDHILPTSWFEHWPLSDGTAGTEAETREANLNKIFGESQSSRQAALSARESAKSTIGNLTLLHYGVNRGLQNREFDLKRERMFVESNLHLNRQLMRQRSWDETEIAERANHLFEFARRIWIAPTTYA